MKAGRELDALIEEKVFGKEVKWGKTPTATYPIGAKAYSTQIADAWLVVEKLGFSIWCAGGPDKYKWGAGYWDWEDGKQDILVYKLDNTPTSERLSSITATAPLAICLAALKAVE